VEVCVYGYEKKRREVNEVLKKSLCREGGVGKKRRKVGGKNAIKTREHTVGAKTGMLFTENSSEKKKKDEREKKMESMCETRNSEVLQRGKKVEHSQADQKKHTWPRFPDSKSLSVKSTQKAYVWKFTKERRGTKGEEGWSAKITDGETQKKG